MGRKRLTKKEKQQNKAIYNQIKRAYDKIEKKNISYIDFRRRVLNEYRYKKAKGKQASVREIAKKESRTRTFLTESDIGKENIINAMKNKFPDTYKEFKEKVGRNEKGQYRKLSAGLKWDRGRDSWVLDGRYQIKIDNSPENIYLIDLLTD